MSGHKGLDKWFKQDWVDIGSKKKGGGFAKCGRSKQKKDAKRKYPKCVPRAKANRMTESQRRSAVSRKKKILRRNGVMADPKVGTGKKPKGSGRRLYTDENPKDTVRIKFATPQDARATVAKVKKVSKPFARKIQILTVGEQRAKVMGKSQVASIFKRGKDAIRKTHNRKRKKV